MSSVQSVRLLSILIVSLGMNLCVNDATHADESREPALLNQVLDDKGNPITIPDAEEPAMEYHFTKQRLKPQITNNRKKITQRRFKDLTRKEMLQSRANIANDPSCRWLDDRMELLEKQLSSGMGMRYGHHQKELSARQKEWVCMKCGVEGPSIQDYTRCQFHR
ncbi:MAG: hypothetical protein ACPGUD_01305 [Parashewanella sp.]